MKNKLTRLCLPVLINVNFLGGVIWVLLISACSEGFDSMQDSPENRVSKSIPIVYITTPDSVEIDSKELWVKGGDIRIIDEYGNESLNAEADFRGRGNSTWRMPKKPYAIKLARKTEILGMPAHKRWVLLANWLDRTLLRNDVSFEIARQTFPWTPRGKFVELYVNGDFRGNYYLCEQIKIDKNRVDIDKIEDADDDITGGYILEFDIYATLEKNHFHTKYRNYPVEIKEPDDDVIYSNEHPAFVYIKEYVDSVEKVFEYGTYEEVQQLIDVKSFADYFLVYNVVGNMELAHPKSCYMYKQRHGKLCAGPVWDFDWGTFRPGYKGLILTTAVWYGYLLEYDGFRILLKERWRDLKPRFEKVQYYIDKQSDWICESNKENLALWPITAVVNGDESLGFYEAVGRMRDVYRERIAEVDAVISSY